MIPTIRRGMYRLCPQPLIFERRGIALLGSGKAKEAVTAFTQARDLFYKVHKAEPQNIEAEYRLASTLNNIATVYLSADQRDPAQSYFLQAFQIFTRLWEQHKDRPDFGKDLAATINNLGLLLSDQHKKQEARVLFQQAQTIRVEVLTLHPNYYAILPAAAKTNENLAAVEKDLNGSEHTTAPLATSTEDNVSASGRTNKTLFTKATGAKMDFTTFCRTHGVGEPSSPQNTHPSILTTCAVYGRFAEAQVELFSRRLQKDFKTNITIEFGFYSNGPLNAFVAQYNDPTYFIGINTGAVAQLANVYADIFARSPMFLSQLRFGPGLSAADRPRAAPAVALSAAMHFLIAHELGHIAYGHLNIMRHRQPPAPKNRLMPWRAQPKIPALLEEMASILQGSQEVPADLSQSMEVDADLYAGSSVVMAVSNHSLCASNLTNVIADRAHLLRLSTIAILIWFHLSYGSDATPLHLVRDASHPLPEVRIVKFLIRTRQMADFISDKFFDPNNLSLLDNFSAVHVPQELRGGFFPMLREQGSARVQAEAQRVRNNEDKYENELGQFSLIPVGTVIS